MRVFFVSWHFPPTNVVAAVRTGKLARFLERSGVDLTVFAPEPRAGDQSLPIEVPLDRIRRSTWTDIDERWNPALNLLRLRRSVSALVGRTAPEPSLKPNATAADKPQDDGEESMAGRLKRQLMTAYHYGVLFPDRQVGWSAHLNKDLNAAIDAAPPDLILASGPPFSALRTVATVANQRHVPWIAEIRDLWSDEAFAYAPEWRRRMDSRVERRVLASAAGIVTVSPLWTDHYRDKYGKPAITVTNGFDPADFDLPSAERSSAGPLTLIHAGTVYPGRRDPTPLFQAIAQAGFEPSEVQVQFVTSDPRFVLDRMHAAGVQHHVQILGPVAYQEALRMQKAADILLLLQWADPANAGNIPAKLFEYFALRRPVLGIGPDNGYPAGLIRERGNGAFSTEPQIIATQLCEWLAKKRAGRLDDLPASIHAGLTRDEQYAAMPAFFANVLKGGGV